MSEIKEFTVAYLGVWMLHGIENARTFPTLSEAISQKRWVEQQPWHTRPQWIELAAIRRKGL